jgi:hypothetical protein
MSRRDLKDGGSLTNSSSLDRTKVYTYDSDGNLVEVNGTTVVLGDNDIAFSGSKSNLRRMADMERNISILATRLIDGSSYTATNTSDVHYSGNFEVSGNFGTQFVEKLEDVVGAMFSASHIGDITITYDDANSKIVFNTFSGEFADLANIPTTIAGYGITDAFDGAFSSLTGTPTTIAGYGITDAYTQSQIDAAISTKVSKSGDTMSGNLNMGSNSVTGLATPVNSTDAVNKLYVDTQVSTVSGDLANIAEYTSWFFSDGTNLSEIGDGSTLVINPGNNISIAYNATSDEYTISSTDTDTNNYVTGLSFNTSDGVLTATRLGLSDLTVDLDGRYQPKVTISGTAPTSPSSGDLWYDNNTDLKIFIYTGSEWVDTVPTAQNNYLTSLSFNSGDGVLTATREGLTDVTVDLDGRYLSSETVTSLSLSSNTLSYVDENGNTTNIDLSLYLDDTNLARLVSGTVNGTTGVATFTRDDATTFTVDFSALFDDTNLSRINSGSFNTSTGNLTLTRTDATTAATISLDGRYIETGATALWTIVDESDNTYPITYTDSLKITGGFSINTAFTGDDVLSISVDTTDLDGRYLLIDDDVYTSSATFDTTTGVITFTRSDASTYTVDIDGRYIETSAAALWTIVDDSNNTYPITYTDSLKITGGFSINTAFTGDDVLSISVDTTDLDGRYLLIDDDVYTSSAAFNNGLITFTRNDATTYSVDIDGRYIETSAAALWTIVDENNSTYPITYTDSLKITGGFSINTAFTGDDVLSISVDTTDLDGRYLLIDDDVYTSSAAFDANTGIITFTRNDTTTYTVDIDGRYIETSAAALWTIVDESNNTYPITYTDSLKITGGTGINTAFTGDDVLTISVDTTYLGSNYDNYGSWTISDGTASEAINSNDTLTIAGSGSTTTSYDSATNTLTISSTGTTYSAGTSTTLGLMKLGSDTTQTVAANAVSSTASRTYAVQKNASGQMVVNVPWVDTNTDTNTWRPITDTPAADSTTSISANWAYTTPFTGVTVNNDTLTFSRPDGTTTAVTTSDANTNYYVTGGSFDSSTQVLTLTRNSGSATVDLSGLVTSEELTSAISNLVNGADAAYDTLKEIQDAMATDAELSAAISGLTIGNGVMTVVAGAAMTGGGTFTANQTDNSSITIAHADTSSQASVNNSGRTYIQDVTLDEYGHVTGLVSATETVTDTHYTSLNVIGATGTTTNAATTNGNTYLKHVENGALTSSHKIVGSGATTVTTDASGNITINSTDTNTTDWRVANSAGTEQFAVSATEQVRFAGSGATTVAFDATTQTITISSTDTNTDTNTTYSAGTGLSLVGTTFNNTAPDQTVTLTGSGATSVSGTYPNFTISSTDTNTVYTLPAATSTIRGGIELFSDTVQTVAANAVSSTASRTYGVQVNSAGQAVVNVPWVDTNTETESFRTQTVTDTDSGYTWAATGSAVADSATDTLTWVSGSGINIDVDATNDAIRISNTYSYTLPAATSTVRGGIELFSDTVQSVAANAVTATASRTYGVQVNSAGQAVVNIPWTDNNTDTLQTIANDTTTNATYYPSFVTATSGAQTAKVSNTKLTFNPSTGTLTSANLATNGFISIATDTGTTTIENDDTLSGWKYSGKSFSVATQETAPTGIFMSSDGTKMFVIGTSGDDINRYDLSTAWDVSTAVYHSVSATIGDTAPQDLTFSPDGTKLYVIGSTGDTIRYFTLSTAWDLSTISFVSAFSVATQDTTPTGIDVKSDGTKIWVAGDAGNTIEEYVMSTAWNISTASLNYTLAVGSYLSTPNSVQVSSDGTKMYVVGTTGDDINRFDLSTPYSLATATYNNNFYVGFELSAPTGLYVDLNNDFIAVVGSNTDKVWQYTTQSNAVRMETDNMFVNGGLYANGNSVVTGGMRIDGALLVSGTSTLGTLTASAFTAGSSTSAVNLGNSHTTGVTTIGGTAGTGNIILGRSTATQTVAVATGATTSGNTKTVNIGTGGVTGSTTNINIGESAAGGTTNIALYGNVTADTATAGTNTTQIATTEFVSNAVANLVNSAPTALDTLNELASALGNDANFSTTVTNSLAGKAATSTTISAGTDLSGGGSLAANRTISHAAVARTNTTSSQSPAHSGSFTVVDSITTSSTGHITGVNTKTITLPADNNTTYGAATSTTLGLVKLEDDTVQTVAANAVTATASRTYGVQVNSSGQMVVNVPWVDTNTETESFRTQTVTDTDSGYTWAATGSAVADSANDILTWVSGSGINIDVDATSDAIRISNTYSYTLPAATSTTLGGIELFSDTVQSVAANAVSATASRTYGVQVNSAGQAVVNVPWANTETESFRTQTVTDTDSGYTWAATGSAVADSATDTLTWVSGSGINIDVDATNDAIRISNTYSYTLPAATSTTLGGIELFSDTVQSVAANAVSATASRTYGVQVNASGQAVVNVPWTDSNTDTKITTSNDTTNATRYVPFVTTAAANQAAQTNTAFTFNPSTATLSVTNITGTSSAAKYSDVAERYETDGANEAGTIMVFGGDKEVTASTKYAQTKIAGVISTAPAYMMNSDAGSDETHPYIALQGRVPCKVVGKVRKGDIIVASEYAGVGQAWINEESDPRMTAYVGIAIEDKDSAGVGFVEVKVGK